MYEYQTITTTADCEAILIPAATPVLIPQGSQVVVTQARGDNVTLNFNGNLVLVQKHNLQNLLPNIKDLLAKEPESQQTASGMTDLALIWDTLRTCFDPEIPVNIVDLGLIYDCQLKYDAALKTNTVIIKMTLTAPACGMGPIIVQEIEDKVKTIANVTDVKIELVFDPPWDKSMMSDTAKLELNMF